MRRFLPSAGCCISDTSRAVSAVLHGYCLFWSVLIRVTLVLLFAALCLCLNDGGRFFLRFCSHSVLQSVYLEVCIRGAQLVYILVFQGFKGEGMWVRFKLLGDLCVDCQLPPLYDRNNCLI